MKFLAILKDSFREAIDGWIFLVMLVLSTVVVLLVASISFQPLPVDQALPKMLRGQGMQMVSADRGQASRMAMFLYKVQASNAETVRSAEKPWESEVRFTLEYSSAGFGPSGVEVDDAKNPKDVKQIEGQSGLISDAFKEAVRYWAGKPGEKPRPEYTPALAAEFVTAQVRDVTRLHITSVTEEAQAGGFFGLGKSSTHKFRVEASGGDRLGWAHRPAPFLGLWEMTFLEMPLGDLVHLVEDTLVHGIGAWVILLAGVIVTAGFIPDMLRKGAIDLLLTKPMSRPLILAYKYLGGMLFVFLLTAYAIGGVWAAVGLRTGVWSPGLLWSVLAITFYFAVLYACSALAGVLTRNTIVSIVVTIVFWFLVWLIGTVNGTLQLLTNLEVQRQPAVTKPAADGKPPAAEAEPEPAAERVPTALVSTFKVLNAITPRTKDLDSLTSRLISQDLLSEASQRQAGLRQADLNWAEVLGIAGAYIALFLGLAMFRFVTRSY